MTARWVLANEIVIPSMIIRKNNSARPELSCNNLKSGNIPSISKTEVQMAKIAINDAIIPLMTARWLMGFAINPRVAPTICIVLIRNLLLYMANLIVLSIENTTKIVSKIAAIKNMMPPVLT